LAIPHNRKIQNRRWRRRSFRIRRVGDRSNHAKSELKRRFLDQEVFGYVVEKVTAATSLEALALKLPERCVMLLG
jgi:hypothetical protein